MPQTSTSPETHAATESPLEQFTQCHAGIRQRLDTLGELPGLLEAAARARSLAAEALDFFRKAMPAHHEDEERELFPAVEAAAVGPDEAAYVKAIAQRLVREHRHIESLWATIEPALKAMARGHDAALDSGAAHALAAAYRAHADYEEQVYLPLAQRILRRRGDREMAALAVSLHMRHVMPQVLAQYGQRI